MMASLRKNENGILNSPKFDDSMELVGATSDEDSTTNSFASVINAIESSTVNDSFTTSTMAALINCDNSSLVNDPFNKSVEMHRCMTTIEESPSSSSPQTQTYSDIFTATPNKIKIKEETEVNGNGRGKLFSLSIRKCNSSLNDPDTTWSLPANIEASFRTSTPITTGGRKISYRFEDTNLTYIGEAIDDDLENELFIPSPMKLFKEENDLSQGKEFAPNPPNPKHKEFYGDVQKTVSKFAEIIDAMPMPSDSFVDEKLPEGLVTLYDHQTYGLKWLSWREKEFPGGGILGDEMGLGKTIIMIALIMKSKADGYQQTIGESWTNTFAEKNLMPSHTTLVICPLGCLLQWSEEISTKGKGLRVHLYHGVRRSTSAAMLAQSDVVLTTYQTIASEIPKPDNSQLQLPTKSPLLNLLWHRIILDEAHTIRNPKTHCAQSICQLHSRHRWAVTGTPIHNKPADLFSIGKFLKLTPFDDPKVWDFWIGLNTVRKNQEARDRLFTIGKALILRRTKAEVEAVGGNIQAIPPKYVEQVIVELTEQEQRVYDHLMLFGKTMFKNFLVNKEQREREMQLAAESYFYDGRKKQQEKVGKPDDIKFTHLFAVLLRLRQCVVLPHLIETMLEDEDIDEDVSFNEFKDEHIVSKRNPIFDRLYISSKIQKILEDLDEINQQAIRESRNMDKVVIVSSWTSILHILYEHIRTRGYSAVFITGKDKMEERMEAMRKFNNNPNKPQILLLSLAAGGVGLNLIGGNYVFFVEPHWNPQLELQAQDRVHRFGQTKDVFVRRYITEDTIEQRVMELQDIKVDLADGLLNNTKKQSTVGLSVAQMRLLFNI